MKKKKQEFNLDAIIDEFNVSNRDDRETIEAVLKHCPLNFKVNFALQCALDVEYLMTDVRSKQALRAVESFLAEGTPVSQEVINAANAAANATNAAYANATANAAATAANAANATTTANAAATAANAANATTTITTYLTCAANAANATTTITTYLTCAAATANATAYAATYATNAATYAAYAATYATYATNATANAATTATSTIIAAITASTTAANAYANASYDPNIYKEKMREYLLKLKELILAEIPSDAKSWLLEVAI